MNERLNQMIGDMVGQLIADIPKLMTGFLLVVVGLICGWLMKRIVIRAAIILKVERFLVRFKQGKAFSKADVRYGLYNLIGNIIFIIIFLIFFEAALITWGRTFLSNLLGVVLNFLPRILTAFVIMGVGWRIASWISKALENALSQENFPRVNWIAQFVKILLLTFFFAMAIIELNFAREIIIIAFASIFFTLCAIMIIIVFATKEEIARIIKDEERGK